ncbi:MAG: DUF4159 domain-containing protein [Planctomycetaceae bacterium]|jgi:hypothetical protein|nr:DUF4159 domain-containing protein [Planctomycetaceae bacterium]
MFRIVFILTAALFFLPQLTAQDLDPEEIRRAIEQGIQFIKNRQRPDGHWDEQSSIERCGSTGLSIIALLSCGVPKNDPAVQRGLQYMRQFPGTEAGRNYGLSLQTMAFCLADPERCRMLIRENVKLLEKNQIKVQNSVNNGGWDYSPGTDRSDLSNSQFSILALYEAERAGVEVSDETWRRALRYWADTQNSNGSWGYTPKPHDRGTSDERGSMTCAGIASLLITADELDSAAAEVNGNRILCFRPSPAKTAEKIKLGFDWMARRFSVSENPGTGGIYLYYYLYALERVGRLTNQRFIGQHDWYREGADKLLKLRDKIDGSWRGQGTGEVPSTAMALLFLSKGRRPVLMSKIQYGHSLSWNVHPNDVNNMTMFTEKQWKIDLTWQIVDIRHATVDHLLQSPVLYLSGFQSPLGISDKETAEMVQKLREYLDQGGFLFAEAQPNDKTFDKGFRELMTLVFPEPGYELKLLEQNHPVWNAEIAVDPEQVRPLEGVNFGCRTCVIYAPVNKEPPAAAAKPSLSCLWEVAKIFERGNPYPDAVQKQIDAGLGIGLNILAYATNKELKYKDQIAERTTRNERDSANSVSKRGKIFISFLDPGGAMNPAPRAAQNLLYWLNEHLGIPVELKTETINPAAQTLSESPLLLMHGRQQFQFSDKQREHLKKYLENGGFLFVNSICSSKMFSDSFTKELQKMFPDGTLEVIPPEDPLFSDEYGGFNIQTLEMRTPESAPGRKTASVKRQVAPQLYGLKLADTERWTVVFSPNDISCALENAGSMECRGYTTDSAMKLAVNVYLYAIEHW